MLNNSGNKANFNYFSAGFSKDAFDTSMTQEAFLNQCIKSKISVDVYIHANHIYNCQILAHDSWVIMIKMDERIAIVYKTAVQAIVPEHSSASAKPASSGQILADVRTQYMRYLSKNRTSGSIKGN